MVPSASASRQVLIWSVPTLVILLSLVWYKRKRNSLRTDPGGTSDSATKAKADKQTNGFVPEERLHKSQQEELRRVPAVEEPVCDKESVVEKVEEPVCEKGAVVEKVEEPVCEKGAVVEKVEEPVCEKGAVVEKVEEPVCEKGAVVEKVEEPVFEEKVEESVCEGKIEESVCEEESVVEEIEESVCEEESVVEEVEEPVYEEKVEESVFEEESVVDKVEEPVFEKEFVVEVEEPVCVEERLRVEELVRVEKLEVEESVPEKREREESALREVEEPDCVEESVPEKLEESQKEQKAEEVLPAEVKSGAMSEEDEGAAVAVAPQEEKVGSLGGKLASLSLEEQRADADRDSANHSPVDAMLASPSLSNYSDEHSEGSSDSGKGCSDVASPPSRTPLGGGSLAGDADADADAAADNDADVRYTVYEFLLPHYLVGRLIGPRGSFVQEIKSKTNATVQVKKHPDTGKQKICVVDGTQSEVDAALAMIRERYPVRKFPQVTLEQVCILSNVQPTCALIPEYCQLHLVEGVNNEVMVSCMVSPGHMFLQQPYHPTFQYLNRLSVAMNSVYSQADAPHVPEPIIVGSICVAPAAEGWYRVQVASVDDENHTCEVKFVDHGGYMTISNSSLRQIHHDFMSVPFQATECHLASIKPAGGSEVWSDEAVRLVDELTRGQMLYAQLYDYTEYSIPLVYLYCCINSLVVLINQELVARGLAELDDVAAAEAAAAAAEAAALVAAAAEVAPLNRQQDLTDVPSEVEAV